MQTVSPQQVVDAEPTATLRGSVVDADQRPVAGARVALTQRVEWLAHGPLAHVVISDERGHFRFDAPLEAERFGVTATLPVTMGASHNYGVSAGVVDADAAHLPLALTLPSEGFRVEGSVVDPVGAPIGGATVEALEVPTEHIVFNTVADASGRYALMLPAGATYLLIASHEQRSRRYQRIEPTDAATDIALTFEPAARPDDEAIAAWLRRDALPIRGHEPGTPLDDLEPLSAMIGDARVVALGEVTHGSSEVFRMKHRIVELLIERLGFDAVALEAGYAQTLALNRYVQTGEGDRDQLIRELVSTPKETVEFAAFVEALRKHNAKASKPVSLHGIDVSSWKAVRVLNAYMKSAGAAPEIATRLEPLSSWAADGTYMALTPLEQARVRKAISQASAWLDDRKETLVAEHGLESWRVARRCAEMAGMAERSYRDPTLRDALMARNVRSLEQELGAGSRLIVSAHNAHATADPWMFQDMGRILRHHYGRNYRVIGTAFGRGGLVALDGKGGGPTTHRANKPDPAGFDAALSLAKAPLLAVDLSALSAGPLRRWLRSPMRAWSIGFMFFDDASAHVPLAPANAFDIVVYIDEVTAAERLAR